jgi:hypothetical protein
MFFVAGDRSGGRSSCRASRGGVGCSSSCYRHGSASGERAKHEFVGTGRNDGPTLGLRLVDRDQHFKRLGPACSRSAVSSSSPERCPSSGWACSMPG